MQKTGFFSDIVSIPKFNRFFIKFIGNEEDFNLYQMRFGRS